MSLDGEWQIAEGTMDQPPAEFKHKVTVPGLVELAQPPFGQVGVKSDRRQAFWYRRTFKIDGPLPPVAVLKIHKAMFGTKVFINGKPAGEHVPCFTPGLFPVRELLKGDGQQEEILVRVGAERSVLPPTVADGHDFEKIRYTPGIYDQVELILCDSPWITEIQTVPDLEAKAVRIVAKLRSASDRVTTKLSCVVRESSTGKTVGQSESASVDVAANQEATVDLRVPIADCKLWSPESPFMYVLEASTPGDTVSVSFGMRTFKLDPASGRAILNGRPYLMRGTNVCIYRFFEDPSRGGKPWREEWVRRLHRKFKAMNWNSIRYCIGFPPEMWYRIADEEGLMIQDEYPIWYGGQWPAGLTAEHLKVEYAEWMRERWNHPCVVIWDAQNESVTQQTGPAIQAVRGLDLSGRPWDNGWATPQAPDDLYECHPYVFSDPNALLGNLDGLPETHLGNPEPHKGRNPMLINEYGWLWLNRDGTPTTLTKQVWANLLGPDATTDQRRLAYARYLAALTEYWRSTRRFAGVLHFCGLGYSREGGQTSDHFIDLEELTFDPSFYVRVHQAFAPVGVSINAFAEEWPTGSRRTIPVLVTNDLDRQVKAEVLFRVDREGLVVHDATQICAVDALGQGRLSFEFAGPTEPGKYMLVAELRVPDFDPVQSLRNVEVFSPEQLAAREGLARGKPVKASSVVTVKGESFPAENAVDGRPQTRWSSQFSDPQWLMVDLGEPKKVSRVELLWENACAKSYAIQTSSDGKEWTDVYKTDEGRGGREEIRFTPATTRYVRMLGTKRATEFGYSLWEFRVFP